MRLINAQTRKLENFQSQPPPYAILSHTWGKHEITFREMRNLNMSLLKHRIKIKGKPGYYKISKACVQALNDGLQYVWVDTCCIDKSSSSELSEAINSMYMWYKRAQVCYAYLDDIDMFDPIRLGPGETGLHDREDAKRFWTRSIDLMEEKDLAQARWFTRGWTLQELIAPKNVMFYIKGWNYVGNKMSMKGKLSRITRIDEATLVTGNLEGVSVARRMSWAANRVTTRTEDLAYCLMGIFDVNMPLLYGEGEKAFVRLQEEIMKDSDDQSLFAWQPLNAMEVRDLDVTVPMDSGDGHGVFAIHPREFTKSGAVRPSSSRTEPYTLTNKGVRMDIPMLDLGRDLFLIILECYYEGDLSHQLGIVVQKMYGGSNNQFVRHNMAGLVKASSVIIEGKEEYLSTVYLCKKVYDTKDYSSVYWTLASGSLQGHELDPSNISLVSHESIQTSATLHSD